MLTIFVIPAWGNDTKAKLRFFVMNSFSYMVLAKDKFILCEKSRLLQVASCVVGQCRVVWCPQLYVNNCCSSIALQSNRTIVVRMVRICRIIWTKRLHTCPYRCSAKQCRYFIPSNLKFRDSVKFRRIIQIESVQWEFLVKTNNPGNFHVHLFLSNFSCPSL